MDHGCSYTRFLCGDISLVKHFDARAAVVVICDVIYDLK